MCDFYLPLAQYIIQATVVGAHPAKDNPGLLPLGPREGSHHRSRWRRVPHRQAPLALPVRVLGMMSHRPPGACAGGEVIAPEPSAEARSALTGSGGCGIAAAPTVSQAAAWGWPQDNSIDEGSYRLTIYTSSSYGCLRCALLSSNKLIERLQNVQTNLVH